jgi:hypothetical protein
MSSGISRAAATTPSVADTGTDMHGVMSGY